MRRSTSFSHGALSKRATFSEKLDTLGRYGIRPTPASVGAVSLLWRDANDLALPSFCLLLIP